MNFVQKLFDKMDKKLEKKSKKCCCDPGCETKDESCCKKE